MADPQLSTTHVPVQKTNDRSSDGDDQSGKTIALGVLYRNRTPPSRSPFPAAHRKNLNRSGRFSLTQVQFPTVTPVGSYNFYSGVKPMDKSDAVYTGTHNTTQLLNSE